MSASQRVEAGSIFSLTRNGKPVASVSLGEQDGVQSEFPALSELQPVGFSVEMRSPDVEYVVFIGDVPVATGSADYSANGSGRGIAIGPNVYWEDGLHLESTRGRVRVHLRSRAAEFAGGWSECATLELNVVPTKLGELRCEAMEDDIRRVASGLIFTLVSKMLRGVRYAGGLRAISHRSSHLELRALRNLWRNIEGLLQHINATPELRLERRVRHMSFTGTELLNSVAIAHLAARGFDPRRRNLGHSMMIPSTALAETADTFEHRLILGFLRLLLVRVAECISAAQIQISRIEQERHLRDVAVGPGPTLFEAIDLPKIDRLRDAAGEGQILTSQLRQAMDLPVFQNLVPQLGEPQTPIFRHVEAYHRVGEAMQRYLTSSLVILEQGSDERLKETSRLYEHWVFIQLADAFREAGLECDDLQGLVRRLSRHRYTLDLDDEMILSFRVDEFRSIRLRYEPWILPIEAARSRGETLCRAGSGAAWAPDVLIEFLEGRGDGASTPDVVYAVVVDAKYSKDIRDHHWSRVAKYAEIRTVSNRRQVVRQVWLAHPRPDGGIRCRDAAVMWTEFGPDRPRDETIMGTLAICPQIEKADVAPAEVSPPSIARQFAQGLMHYMHFLPVESEHRVGTKTRVSASETSEAQNEGRGL